MRPRLQRLLLEVTENEKIRYLVAGGFNTVFGYCAGAALYYLLRPYLHIVVIGCISYPINITVSFLTYKLFVFRSRGNGWAEYLRSYVVYGVSGAFGVLLLWLMVDGIGLSFLIAQALVILLTIIGSYIGHARFTFRRQTDRSLPVGRE